VTEEKLCLWLQEDILNRRTLALTPRRLQPKGALGKRKKGSCATAIKSTEEEDLVAIAAQLQVPLEAVPDMLADNQLNASDLVEINNNGDVIVPRALFKSSTVNSYVAAMTELHKVQYSTGLPVPAVLQGLALRGLLESRKRAQDANNRAAFVDYSASGITAGYTSAEFLQLQELLLRGSEQSPLVSLVLWMFILIFILIILYRTTRPGLTCFLGTS
jgi:hypothetical protein